MKTLFFECAAGISGDMTAAALLDLGADRAALERAVASLPLSGFRTKISRVKKAGISCLDFHVILDRAHENHDHDMAYLYGSLPEQIHADGGCEDPDAGENRGRAECEDPDAGENRGRAGCEDPDAGENDESAGNAKSGMTHADREENGHGSGGHRAHHEHRSYADVRQVLAKTDMTDTARTLAEKIFRILAEAEAEAHNVPVDEVHFHEVGAVDSIVDVVACAVLMDSLRADAVVVPPLAEGTGMIRCQHGILPVPVPAVLNIAKRQGIRLHIHQDWQGERVTPTGAAFLAAVKTTDEIPCHADITAVGYGAGKRDYEPAGILRVILFESGEGAAGGERQETISAERTVSPGTVSVGTAASSGDKETTETIWCLETNIDDCTGEQLGYCMEKLFAAGVRDAHYEPCFMKKSRPAWILRALCTEEKREAVEQVIFRETTTIGIRRFRVERSCLDRRVYSVRVRGEDVRIKAAEGPDGWKMKPEYEDAAHLAKKYDLSFSEASEEILREAESAAAKECSGQAQESAAAKECFGQAQAEGEDTGSGQKECSRAGTARGRHRRWQI